jgi:hypothetical protein
MRSIALLFVTVLCISASAAALNFSADASVCKLDNVNFLIGEGNTSEVHIDVYLLPDAKVASLDFTAADNISGQWNVPFAGQYEARLSAGNVTLTRGFVAKDCQVLEPPLIIPLRTNVTFVKMPVLVEMRKGENAVMGTVASNNATLDADMSVNVTGIPADWVDVAPKKVSIPPAESKGINFYISVPADANAGNYKVEFLGTYFVLRVRPYGMDEELPTVTRKVFFEGNSAKVALDVRNGRNFAEKIDLVEDIPKEVGSASHINFSAAPEVLSSSMVVWHLDALDAYESRTISYETSGFLGEASQYIFWPIRQVGTLLGEKEVVDVQISAPPFRSGSAGNIVVSATSSKTVNARAYLEAGEDWEFAPEGMNVSLTQGTNTLTFSAKPAHAGTYTLRAHVKYRSIDATKDITVVVEEDWTPLLYVLPVLAGIAVFYVGRRISTTRRGKMVSTLREIKQRMK